MKRSTAWKPALVLSALGATPSALAGIVGNNLQNFSATPDGIDFVTLQSSETLKPGVINFGLFFNYAINPLPYVDTASQGRLKLNDSVLGMDLNFGIGLLPGWEIGFSAPSVIAQTVSSQASHGEFAKGGNIEVRPMTKVRLYGDDHGGVALVGSVNFNRTVNNPFVGVDAGPTYNLELAADTTIGSVAWGFNAGYRFANPGAPVPGSNSVPIGNQITGGTAVSYLIPNSDTKVISELYGAMPTNRTNSNFNRSATSLELLAGVKHDFSQQIAGHAGLGTGLGNGFSSPDWRIYTGINFAIGPLFKKETAILKGADKKRLTIRAIVFDFNSDELSGDYVNVLKDVADTIAQYGSYQKLVVEGHTDSIGNSVYNQNLSQRRAERIRTYMIEAHRLDAKKIEARGMGEALPIADNGNFQGRQENRRVEIHID